MPLCRSARAAVRTTRRAFASAVAAVPRSPRLLRPVRCARRSPCCSATCPARPRWASASTPSRHGASCLATSTRCARRSSATAAPSRSSSATRSWPCSASRWCTRTTPYAPFARLRTCGLHWPSSTRSWTATGASGSRAASASTPERSWQARARRSRSGTPSTSPPGWSKGLRRVRRCSAHPRTGSFETQSRRSLPSTGRQGEVGTGRSVPAHRSRRGRGVHRAPTRLSPGRPGKRARPAPARLRPCRLRASCLPVHAARSRRDREVEARSRARGPRRRNAARRSLPALRGGDHVLAARRDRASRRRDRLRGQPGRDRAADPPHPRADGTRAATRSRLRRPPVGGADVPRPRRPRHRPRSGRAAAPALRRPAGAARSQARLGRWEAERDDDAARRADRRRSPRGSSTTCS